MDIEIIVATIKQAFINLCVSIIYLFYLPTISIGKFIVKFLGNRLNRNY